MQLIDLARKNRFTLLLMGMSIFSVALSIFRWRYTHTPTFLFLNWNLFLAFVPWALTYTLQSFPRLASSKWMIVSTLFCWLLFFPNAPYILTDLYHLRILKNSHIWFDVVLILSFAWTGTMYGMMSLYHIEKILIPHFHRFTITALIVILQFAAGFGIYIGRFLRWNSWDIIQHPGAIVTDIADRFIDPASHPRTWAVTILMGIFLNMVYWSARWIHPEIQKQPKSQ